ncbi:hypothetical protein FACS1894153_2550 [Bacteroidia bacterium]|nr:hypothetical protein FACS1894153_2550 [Bacteroidia bacterium]
MWAQIAGLALNLGSQLYSGYQQSKKAGQQDKIRANQKKEISAMWNDRNNDVENYFKTAMNTPYLDTEDGASAVNAIRSAYSDANNTRSMFGGGQSEEMKLARMAGQDKALAGTMNNLAGAGTAYKINARNSYDNQKNMLFSNWQTQLQNWDNYDLANLEAQKQQQGLLGSMGAGIGNQLISAFGKTSRNE